MPTLEEHIIKARAYGIGQIPVKNPAPQLHKSISGICDYCNKKQPVVKLTDDKEFYICWTCECFLLQQRGSNWQELCKPTFEMNRRNRMQTLAQKSHQQKQGNYV